MSTSIAFFIFLFALDFTLRPSLLVLNVLNGLND